jgi:hypothetical protein
MVLDTQDANWVGMNHGTNDSVNCNPLIVFKAKTPIRHLEIKKRGDIEAAVALKFAAELR